MWDILTQNLSYFLVQSKTAWPSQTAGLSKAQWKISPPRIEQGKTTKKAAALAEAEERPADWLQRRKILMPAVYMRRVETR
jgi:hypothetical protein